MIPHRTSRLRPSLAAAVIVFLFLGLAGAGRATAQQAVTSATLSGRILDANGAAVSGAHVTATNLETNQRQTATCDEEGRYRFAYLSVGTYRLAAEAEGFAALQTQVALTVGQALDVPLRLTVLGVAEEVNVTVGVNAIETVRTQVAETVGPREVDSLPLNGRHFLDLALLAPGVSPPNTGATQRFAETSAVPGQGLSVAGQRNLNNSLLLDGLSANDDAAGLTGSSYSQEVVREFQVVTAGGGAEFGRASAGVVNVLTRSGTNLWRGRLYGYLRDGRLDARNPLAPAAGPLTQAQYGVSLGGPLRRDRTFLFANLERARRRDAAVVTIAPAAAAAVNARLAAAGYRGPRLATGLVGAGHDSTNLFARLDHEAGGGHRLTARYSLYDLAAANSRTAGGLNAASRGTGLENLDQTLAAGLVSALGAGAVNELRLQLTRSRLAAPVNDPRGPAVNIAGVASFGTATFSPVGRDIDLLEVADSVSAQRGAHSLKAGADFLHNRVGVDFPGALPGVYTFSSLAEFLAGRYAGFQQAFGAAVQRQSNPNLGLFAQDEWRARADLTVNLGLRYDAQYLPDPVETDGDNIGPRLGVAYAPGGGRAVVRASAGLYYDRIPLRATSNALQRDGTKYVVVQLGPGEAGAPAFPGLLAGRPEALRIRPNVTRIDPGIENGYSGQFSLQVERALPGGGAVSAGYVGLRGRHLILARNVNAPRLTAAEAARLGVANLGRPDPEWGNVSRFESSGRSRYDGLVVALQHRAGGWWAARLSYTLSKAEDDAGGFFFSTPQDSADLRAEWGPADNDQRHRLVVSGTLEGPRAGGGGARGLLRGFGLGYVFTYGSRPPFNPLTGDDRNGDTTFNDRPAGAGRNSWRGFDYASLDVRVSRRVKLTERVEVEVLAEGFNVLNRTNLTQPNNTFGRGLRPLPDFGRATAAHDARQIQLGLRLNF